jgi:hypothetical protein
MEKKPEAVAQEFLSKLERADQNKSNDPSEKLIPHQAVVTITCVITQQMDNGTWHPRSAFDDEFLLILRGNSEKEVKDDLLNKLRELKEQWEKTGGEIGRHK